MKLEDNMKKSVFNLPKEDGYQPKKNNDDAFEAMDPEDIQYAKIILNLKKKEKRLYETEIAGEKIIWRPLKRSEYKAAFNLTFPEDMDEYDKLSEREAYIANCVVLYPEGIVEDLAAVAEIITDLCMEKSGFGKKDYEAKEL